MGSHNTVAEQGKQLAMAMDGVTVGKQIEEGDFLYSDVPEKDFKKLKVESIGKSNQHEKLYSKEYNKEELIGKL